MNKTDKICRTDEFVISKVPLDIIYKICQFMNIVDICKFRRINKIIFYNITLIQYDLLSYQLKLQCDFTNCNYFHNWLNTYLSRHLYQYNEADFLFKFFISTKLSNSMDKHENKENYISLFNCKLVILTSTFATLLVCPIENRTW